MEGAALRTAILLDRLRACGLAPLRLAVVGGWADCPAWNRIRADATGLEVVRTQAAEATALGTAMYCRAAVDPGTSLAEITRQWVRPAQTYRPNPRTAEAWRRIAGLFEDYLNSAEAVFRRLSQGDSKDYNPGRTA
jgi:xylulokinase